MVTWPWSGSYYSWCPSHIMKPSSLKLKRKEISSKIITVVRCGPQVNNYVTSFTWNGLNISNASVKFWCNIEYHNVYLDCTEGDISTLFSTDDTLWISIHIILYTLVLAMKTWSTQIIKMPLAKQSVGLWLTNLTNQKHCSPKHA